MNHDFNEEISENLSEQTHEVSELENNLETLSISPLLGYGAYKISQMPEVREFVQDKIESLKDYVKEHTEGIGDFVERATIGIKDFCCGVYEDVKDFFSNTKHSEICDIHFPECARLSEGITEGRDFGLEQCSEAASEIFNPGVIANWGSLSEGERRGIALAYADEVAKAFDLENYNGVIIEKMEDGILGSNNGDGYIHITSDLIHWSTTPFEIMNTITHELRHQYQSECIRGYHDVSDEVRNEWAVATDIYNYDNPTCYDPWGYKYNPLEIDSNYAGDTVVRNVTSQMFNDFANA